MLGKLYVSPTSTPEKLQATHELLTDAIEARIATDAPSRNALNKLLTALTKAIGASGAASTTASATVARTGAEGGIGNGTVCEDGATEMDVAEEQEEEVVEKMEDVEAGEKKDSVLGEAEAVEEL